MGVGIGLEYSGSQFEEKVTSGTQDKFREGAKARSFAL